MSEGGDGCCKDVLDEEDGGAASEEEETNDAGCPGEGVEVAGPSE